MNYFNRPIFLLASMVVLPLFSAQSASAQISSCSHGELFEFAHTGAITFTADATNPQLFTASAVENGINFDFTVLDRGALDNALLTPTSGTNHSQNGGGATNGAIRLRNANTDSDATVAVDVTVDISGGFVTEAEFYAHDVENREFASFGSQDYVTGSLAAHPGATIIIDAADLTATGNASNTNSNSNRSAFAQYSNVNGLSTLAQTHGSTSSRLGTGIALGAYCVSAIEAVAETFPSISGAGGVTLSVLTSDTLNGASVDPVDVNLTLEDITGPDGNPSTAVSLNADGTITVPAGTPPGTYEIGYEICDVVNSSNCSSVTEMLSVTFSAAPQLSMTKVADNKGPHKAGDVITYTYTVSNVGNVNVNDIAITDTHNGSDPAPVPVDETLVTDAAPTGDSLDAGADGTWDVLAPGDVVTFKGTYTVTQIDVENL